VKVKNLFKEWHKKEHYKYIAAPSIEIQTRSLVKFTIEYFTLFLKKHIPPLPPGVLSPLLPAAKSWRNELEELTDAAWEDVIQLFRKHGQKPSDKVSVFKKWMTELSATDDWPAGPPGESCFQPPAKRYKMRTYDELSAHQEKTRKKRAAVQEGSRKRARGDNTTAAAAAAAAGSAAAVEQADLGAGANTATAVEQDEAVLGTAVSREEDEAMTHPAAGRSHQRLV
jgi:hypothetical protein